MRKKLRLSVIVAVSLAFAATSALVAAKTYPDRPIRLIVPIAAGGSSDTFARMIAPKLGEALGQPIVVENRPGASSIIGHDVVAKAAPDGYTILLASTNLAVNPSLFTNLPHTIKDFEPVSLLGLSPYALLAPTSLPAKTAADLVALAKSKPGTLNYASGGNGSGTQMVMELFKQKAGGIDLTHVPYKGTAPAMTDLIGGQVQALFVNIAAAKPFIDAGRLKALGITGAKRSAMFPAIPTVSESVPGFEAYGSNGIVAPAGTPRSVVDRLNAEIAKVMNLPDIKARLESEGVTVVAGTPEAYAKFIKDDTDRWAEVVKTAGIKVQ